MKKRINSLVALGLAVCLTTACGSTVTNEETSEVAQESSKVESTTPTSEVTEEESIYPDYLNLDSARPIVKDGEEVTLKIVTYRESIADTDINNQWFVKFIEEKLNINLEIRELTDENLAEAKNLMLAADDMPDIMMLSLTNAEVYQYGVDGGQLLPMSDYFSEELTPNILAHLAANESIAEAATTPDGKMYAVRALGSGQNVMGTYRVFIDTKYLEAAEIEEVPTTLEGFLDMLRAFKELDPAALGLDECYPMVTRGGHDVLYLHNAFGWPTSDAGKDTTPTWDAQTDSIVVPCLTEKYEEYIKLYHTLYTEGLLHPDYFTMDGTAARALYAEGKSGVNTDAAPYLSNQERYAEFVLAEPLTSDWSGEKPVVTREGGFGTGSIFISAATEYPEVCMRLIDYLCSPEGNVYAKYGAPQGSEDTMGIIEGFYLNDEGKIGIPEVDSGECESTFDYQVNKIKIGRFATRMNDRIAELHALEMLGVEDPKFAELDLTNPDDHYKYLCLNGQQDYLVYPLPDTYMSTEQSTRLTDLQTVLENYLDQEFAKFVVGQRPIEEAGKLREELMSLGGDEYLELVKEVYGE